MKYAFNDRPGQELVEIELNNFQLIIHQQGKDRVIPYSAITNVRLERRSDFFFMTLQSLDFGSIRINNRLYNQSRQWQDQSRQYHTFVRVLHLHLLNTSCGAEFCSGFKPNSVTLKSALLVILSVLVYLSEDYFDILSIHPFVAACATLGLGALLLGLAYLKNPPKSYKPSHIPLNMLPPAA